MVEVTKAGLSRRLRISHTRVAQLVEKGLPILPNGKFDLATALAWIEKNAPIKSKVLLAARDNKAVVPADDLESLDHFLRSLAGGEYPSQAESERAKSAALAGLRILELRRKSGELIEIEAATTAFFECARATRDALTAWPGEIGPLLAADLDVSVERVTRFLVEHVRKFLVGLGEPDGATLRGDADHR
jgi:phage terminase Nu1 subunit (DNA packaging protein)